MACTKTATRLKLPLAAKVDTDQGVHIILSTEPKDRESQRVGLLCSAGSAESLRISMTKARTRREGTRAAGST